MMKKVSLNALLLLLAILLSSCSGGGTNTAADSTPSESGAKKPSLNKQASKTITYYVWGNQNEFKVINNIVNAFMEENPDIQVKIERSTGDYYQQLKMRMGSNSGPDVFFMDVSEYAMFANKGFLLPLDDYIAKSDKFSLDELWPINDMYRYDGSAIGQGALYALIKDWSSSYVLFYNKKHFDELGIPHPAAETPMTWNEFYEIARKLTKKNAAGKIERYGTIIDFDQIRHLQEWIAMAGGKFYADDLKSVALNTPEARKAIDFYIQLQKGDDAPAKFSSEAVSMNSGDMFANGLASMVFYGRWAVPSYFDSATDLDYGYALPPIPEGGTKGAMAAGLISHAINAKSKNPDLAYRFLEYLQTEGQKLSAEVGFNIPGNKKVAETVFAQEQDPFKKGMNEFFLKYAQTDVIKPVTNPYMSQVTLDGLVGKQLVAAILGEISTDEAIANIEAQVNKELRANSN